MKRQFFLASNSKARKRLFTIFGVPFKTISSGADESEACAGRDYPALAKKNALAKAVAASKKTKQGVIVAADTIVVYNNRVFGKPKDIADACRMLKLLSGKAQVVYTGLAVLDKGRNITRVSCVRTKIYMDKLSDKEIKRYFSMVSPLDKAGSFDIQGRGAFFIRRIEGCFYNVVGLPLRELFRMFRAMRIPLRAFAVFVLPAICLLSGCSTEYNVVTQQEESYYYSTDREVQMGKSISQEIEKEEKLFDDPLVADRIEQLGQKVAAVCDRKDIDYTFKVFDNEEVNAVSLPGGFVYVNKGLIDKVENDDELVAVLAHEVGHIVARHSIKKLQGMMVYSLLRLLTLPVPQSGGVGRAADVAFVQLIVGYSRQDELLADQLGARYTKLAGYDPHAMITFLKKLQDINKRRPLTERNYLKTHPYTPDRIRVVKQELGESIGFTDYINIEEKKE